MSSDNNRLQEASGFVTRESRLVSFLYQLMRDHLPPGQVEEIFRESNSSVTSYSNGWLAQYAGYLAEYLTAPPPISDVWTTKTPTSEGKYWYRRRGDSGSEEIVRVWYDQGKLTLRTFNGHDCTFVESTAWEWQGPLEPSP